MGFQALVTRKTQFLKARERGELIQGLVDAGLLDCEKTAGAGAGRPSVRFRVHPN